MDYLYDYNDNWEYVYKMKHDKPIEKPNKSPMIGYAKCCKTCYSFDQFGEEFTCQKHKIVIGPFNICEYWKEP